MNFVPPPSSRVAIPSAANRPRGRHRVVHHSASTPLAAPLDVPAPGDASQLVPTEPTDTTRPAAPPDPYAELLGHSAPMHALRERIARVAPTNATVLISGETGTGKELVARALHAASPRRDAPFVALNCGAVSRSLVESELFGHERGAFTGASRLHHGVFAQADGGTLFLDEVTEMPADLQVRLLRVLESGTFQRLGAERSQRADVRILAATNVTPLDAVRTGRLREDLYYRLQVVPIELAPLRERDGDVVLLACHFLAALDRRNGTQRSLTPLALERLVEHTWPGNVRELQHVVHQAYIMADDDLDGLARNTAKRRAPTHIEVAIGASVATAERQLLLATLHHCDGNKVATAAMLGVSLKTLYSRLAVYKAAKVGVA